ncbi:hypothetical protein D3C80_1145100 [compost metagenome]
MAEMKTVNSRLLVPARPRVFMSPISATPITRAENSSGSTIMNSSRRKICPAGPVMLEVSHRTQGASPPTVRLTVRPPSRPIRKPISIST